MGSSGSRPYRLTMPLSLSVMLSSAMVAVGLQDGAIIVCPYFIHLSIHQSIGPKKVLSESNILAIV